MTFFRQFMRLLASAGAVAAVALAQKLVALFQGPSPSDVSPMIWGVVGIVGVFVVNWLVSKIPQPSIG